MTTIELETVVNAPIDVVFDLARDIDLHEASMVASGERAIDGRRHGSIELGETVTWRARHFRLWWSLTSRITMVDHPVQFVDEQVRGPFRSFRHLHRFESIGDRTRMIDQWEHVAPFGPLGWIADRLVLASHMRRLLVTRNRALREAAERSGRLDG